MLKQEENWAEKEFEEYMRPYIDEIYRKLYSRWGLKHIYRSDRSDDQNKYLILDIEFAIDTILEFDNGTILTFQEKTLQYTKQHFQQFTIEYYNDPETGEKGDWFKLAAQRYFFGYATPQRDGYLQYWILDVPITIMHLTCDVGIKQLEEKWLRPNTFPKKANFFVYPFKFLERCGAVIDKDIAGFQPQGRAKPCGFSLPKLKRIAEKNGQWDAFFKHQKTKNMHALYLMWDDLNNQKSEVV